MIYGLTCQSEMLKEIDKKKYSFQKMTRKRFLDLKKEHGKTFAVKELSERIMHNLRVMQYFVKHCSQQNIGHYRVSSALFPLVTDSSLDIEYTDLPNHKGLDNHLNFIGEISRKFNISMGSHPDQFNVLASTNKDAVEKSVKELNFQASIPVSYTHLRAHET